MRVFWNCRDKTLRNLFRYSLLNIENTKDIMIVCHLLRYFIFDLKHLLKLKNPGEFGKKNLQKKTNVTFFIY